MRRRICFKFSSCKCCSRQGGSQKRWGNTGALTWNFLLKVKLISRISTAKERAQSTNAPSSVWWEKVDSNHRRQCQQIYSLSPLASREFSHIKLELVIGVEPTTCWLQISCSAIEPHQHNRPSQRTVNSGCNPRLQKAGIYVATGSLTIDVIYCIIKQRYCQAFF